MMERTWEAILTEQMRTHRELFFHLAHQVLGNKSAAEDVCQDAVVKALESRDQIRDPRAIKAWLATTVTRMSFERVRAAEAERRAMRGRAIVQPASDPPAGEAEETREYLLAMLAKLPEKTRTVVALRTLARLSVKEVKALLGCGDSDVSQHFHAGLARLRELMQR